MQIDDKNDYKLITVFLPKGKYNLEFKFEDTLVRKIGNYLSLLCVLGFLISLKYFLSLQ